MPKESFPNRHESTPSRKELSKIETQVFERLVKPYKESAIQLDSFSDLYKSSIIAKDKEEIEKRKAKFEHLPSERRAQILEAILGTQIELSNWFGESAETLPTSEYDDLFHGIDMAVEFEDETSYRHMALSIDAASSPNTLEKKLGKIKEHILSGELSKIKYFVSERMQVRGEQRNIPNVVVGANAEIIEELSNVWLNIDNLKKIAGEREKDGNPLSPEAEKSNHERFIEFRTKLEKHPIQLQILEQIKMQLSTFGDFARSHNQEMLADRYQAMLKVIDDILAEKQNDKELIESAAKQENPISLMLEDLLRDFK